jgi:hypothetical protein
VTPVHGITVKNDDLVIATHGRSFYVLDNINVLRQIGRDTTNDPVVLFKPGDATRSISRGVTVDYFLKQAADKVTIEFLDARGELIRSFTGDGKQAESQTAARPGGGEEEEEGSFRRPPARVATKQGLNRFVWDMRYSDARTFPGLIMWAGTTRGPAAPPGQYQVRLTAAGQTKTQPFAIVRNPLGTATDADLQEQFRLAKQINDRVTAANEAVLRLRSIKEQIGARLEKLKDAKLKATGDTLTEKLTDVEGEIYQYRNRSSQDPLNFPIRLNNKLAALQSIVESGDYKPTDQSYAVFKQLAAQLEKQLARVDVLIETDVDAFNKQIVRKKLDPIKTEVPAPR